MITSEHRKQLNEDGYTVVSEVLTAKDADAFRKGYEHLLEPFTSKGDWPYSDKSMIQHYKIGHSEPSWALRLRVKQVFASLYGTDKLLTSFDGVAIGRPPEQTQEDFAEDGEHWLHSDQGRRRVGFHGYQGAVYLEECETKDWAFEVMVGSHKKFETYYTENEDAIRKVQMDQSWRLKRLTNKDVEWYVNQGCPRKRVSVPKGGMLLWDSRLIHANARPIRGRDSHGRWRFVVFVCMGPAAWSDEESLSLKKRFYNEMIMTTHWPCNCIKNIEDRIRPPPAVTGSGFQTQYELPPSALTTSAKQLAGVLSYPGQLTESEVIDRPLIIDVDHNQ